MTDRAERKRRRAGAGLNTASHPVVWVAPDKAPLVSDGVQAVPMSFAVGDPNPPVQAPPVISMPPAARVVTPERAARDPEPAKVQPKTGEAKVAEPKRGAEATAPKKTAEAAEPKDAGDRPPRRETRRRKSRRERHGAAAGDQAPAGAGDASDAPQKGAPKAKAAPDGEKQAGVPSAPEAEDRRQRLKTVLTWLSDRQAEATGASRAIWGDRQLVQPLPGVPIPRAWEELPDPMGRNVEEEELVALPPEVDAAAERVMAQYDMTVSGMRLITTKPDKGGAIWRIETNRGPRSLKLLHRQASRSLFSVGAQEYLVGQQARVPALVPSRSGAISVETDGKLWIVTDWVEPLVPATKVDLEGAAALCYGLGEFHLKSRGYVPPPGAYNASRLHRWPKAYQKVLTKMGWFREVARAYPEMPASRSVLSLVDMFEQQARDAIARLEASPYGALVARGEQAWGVVHQDYGWSNGQIGPGGGIWIIDLDGVAFDLPIRDLRKLITSTMDDMGVWDLTWINGMIDAYNQANPMEPDLYQVLLIDLALPNEFYKHVKAGVTKNQKPSGLEKSDQTQISTSDFVRNPGCLLGSP